MMNENYENMSIQVYALETEIDKLSSSITGDIFYDMATVLADDDYSEVVRILAERVAILRQAYDYECQNKPTRENNIESARFEMAHSLVAIAVKMNDWITDEAHDGTLTKDKVDGYMAKLSGSIDLLTKMEK